MTALKFCFHPFCFFLFIYEFIYVRELACVSLTSLLRTADEEQVGGLKDRFLRMLGAPSRAKLTRSGSGAPAKEGVAERHGGALGLAALLNSRPYTVPRWVPALLMAAAAYDNDSMPNVRDCIKRTFAEWVRTHQDSWELHQHAFTEDQLAVIQSVARSPSSYYL
jgi:proteasome activator subunit 4